MKNILYVRVSSILQNLDRQKINENDYDLVIEDKCSGSISLFERDGGKKLKSLIEKKVQFKLTVWTIDRLGRDLRDIMNSLHFFNQNGVCVEFVSQSIKTLNEDGTENPISKMMISILGVVAEMEKNQIKERQREGIEVAKLKGIYLGRKKGSKEDLNSFLNKPKHQKVIEYLKKGYKAVEISQLVDVHINTITKIKKLNV
jgi:DNA invertase Pin-like site-specific DNA recombinase